MDNKKAVIKEIDKLVEELEYIMEIAEKNSKMTEEELINNVFTALDEFESNFEDEEETDDIQEK